MQIPQALYSSMRFVFLYADMYEFRKGWMYPETTTPYCLLRYIIEGDAVFHIDGIPLDVHAGEVVYISEGNTLKCYSDDDVFSFYSIRFVNTLRLNDNDFLSEFFSIPKVSKNVPDCVQEYFQALYLSASSSRIDKLFRIRGYLELIIAELVNHANRNEDPDSNGQDNQDSMSLQKILEREQISNKRSRDIKSDSRIQLVVSYIIANPTEKFNEDYLCRLACLSSSSLRRLFKLQTGKSPSHFAKELKMLAAARELLTTDFPIATLSTELGYEDPNYFSRAFKKVFGVSPMNYRSSARSEASEQTVSKNAINRQGQLADLHD